MKSSEAGRARPGALKDLELLIRSRYGAVHLDTLEEDRAEALLLHAADALGLPFFSWSRTKGLRRLDGAAAEQAKRGPGGGMVYGSMDPAAALGHVECSKLAALYQFQGLGAYLEDKVVSGRLKDAAQSLTKASGCIIITGAIEVLPEGLRPVLASLKLAPPGPKEYRSLLGRILRDVSRSMRVRMELTAKDLQRLLANLRGLTLLEAEKVLTKAVVEDGHLGVEDITKVIEAKKAIVEREGLLEYYPSQEPLDSIAGMAGLKDWLAKRRGIITEPERAAEYGLGFPKGVLLLGVQGCGKSLFAKAVSAEWGLPLLKLDPSNLYNKYVGESEKNFARAVRIAERLAPVVLWIDEIEKAFAQSGSTDDGISQRILGSFLSWLQERKGDVFVVATANDIARLPPEFIRKGRFDEIFFVDLPSVPAREAILGIHLSKRGQKPGHFDLPALVRATEGFSGAEIEQVVVAALYTAFASGSRLDTGLLLQEASKTFPLSKTMREKVGALREWARTRTVPAD